MEDLGVDRGQHLDGVSSTAGYLGYIHSSDQPARHSSVAKVVGRGASGEPGVRSIKSAVGYGVTLAAAHQRCP